MRLYEREKLKYSIKRISPHTAGKISAAMMGSFAIVFWPIILFAEIAAEMSTQKPAIPAAFNLIFLFFPIFYAIAGYIMTVVMCSLYNFYSKYIGQIKIEMEIEQIDVVG